MRLVYLTANAAWVFLFGDEIIDLDGTRFFQSRQEAVGAARTRGLRVQKNGQVESEMTEIVDDYFTFDAAQRWMEGATP